MKIGDRVRFLGDTLLGAGFDRRGQFATVTTVFLDLAAPRVDLRFDDGVEAPGVSVHHIERAGFGIQSSDQDQGGGTALP